ncbi:hypothetical protein AHF37_09306 [Paragonimus kellicotti]|nr:hypothetical protein AHF37_09306 [Paragonimus kellicotti]
MHTILIHDDEHTTYHIWFSFSYSETNTSDKKTQLINQRKSEHRMSRINTHHNTEHKDSLENGLQSVDRTRAG